MSNKHAIVGTSRRPAVAVSTMILGSVLSAVALGSFALATPAPEEHPSDGTVSVKQFGSGNVIGHLGHPLGTVVRITGVCLDGSKSRRRTDSGKTLLEIRTVNGSRLERPFVVPFSRVAKGVSKPKNGEAFDYYAHEWGEFDGIVAIPKDLNIDVPQVANDGFYYRPQITIHKANTLVAESVVERGRAEP